MASANGRVRRKPAQQPNKDEMIRLGLSHTFTTSETSAAIFLLETLRCIDCAVTANTTAIILHHILYNGASKDHQSLRTRSRALVPY